MNNQNQFPSRDARMNHCLICEKDLSQKAKGILRFVCSPECQKKYVIRRGREMRESHRKA